MAKEVSDKDLLKIIKDEFSNAETQRAKTDEIRRKCLSAYNGEYPVPDKQEGTSKAVVMAVHDTVNNAMPSILGVFESTDKAVNFSSRKKEEQDVAQNMTEYANFVFNDLNPRHNNLNTSVFNGLLCGTGFLKTYWKEDTTPVYENYNNLNYAQVANIENSDAEILEQKSTSELQEGELEAFIEQARQQYILSKQQQQQEPMEEELEAFIKQATEAFEMEKTSYDLKTRRVDKDGYICIEAPEPDSIYVSAESENIADNRFVCEKTTISKSELVSMKYDEKIFTDIAKAGNDSHSTSDNGNDTRDDTMEVIDFYDCFIKFDKDSDGIAELLHVVVVGDDFKKILSCEAVPFHPYTCWTPIQIANNFYGRSLAGTVLDIQDAQSKLLRQTLNNAVAVNNPKILIDAETATQQMLDGLKSTSAGQMIPVKGLANKECIRDLTVPFTAGQTHDMQRYFDDVKEERTGISKQSMGLNPDTLQNASATAVSMSNSASQKKLELYCRNFAENCLKPAIKKIVQLAIAYLDDEAVAVYGDFGGLETWNADMLLQTSVGLGTGSQEQKLMALSMVANKQIELMGQVGLDSPYININSIIATNRKLAEYAGLGDATAYFPDVSEEEEMAYKEQQEQMAMQQPPADPIKQQELALKEKQLEIELLKVQLKDQNDKEKLRLEDEKNEADLSLKTAELKTEAGLKIESLRQGNNTPTNIGI